MDELIYMDNAATAFPKPPEVLQNALDFYQTYGVNPGRSGTDLALEAEAMVTEARKTLAAFFGATGDSDRLVFTQNASDSLNIAIQGLVQEGDHVITTCLDHNSVLRPVYHLEQTGQIEATYLPFDSTGFVDPDDVAQAIQPNTRLVVMTHGSNVLGTIQPVAEIGHICRASGVAFVVDVAQTAGMFPIDMEAMKADVICFTGHKSLMGPPGIGGMYVREGVTVEPLRYGGTGVRSEYPDHLEEYPWRLECGTLNLLGIAGLLEGQRWIAKEGPETIYERETTLLTKLVAGLKEVDGVILYCADRLEHHLPVLSLNVAGMTANNVGTLLDVKFNVATRTGLQCAPRVHEQLGTKETKGTVRISLGPFNTEAQIDTVIEGLQDIVQRHGNRN
ncbi:MAG: aminotransferase class V-fold PLP-dependent enzyme [bacterium]|nr:aminotransferase class V-fold PLP-dependent enzyme [bacterium]